ncbi:MAG TPA: hypothetical protein VFB72_19790, partial [Verrucomicrobiae bacterium]|nr:hypothetical protein [Verrucomicrobiae bacterium]
DAFRDDWLDVAIDWPTLMRHHPFNPPAPLPTPLPKMHLTVSNAKGKQEDHVRPKLVVQYPEALQLKLDPWKIPTDMVRNPLVSFTAVRGVAPWLSQVDVIKKAQPPFVPNQLVFWSMAKRAFESGVAMPVPNASNYLAQVGPRLVPELINYFTARTMPNRLVFTNGQIFFHGMPFIIPNLTAVHEADGDFLRGQLMPIVHRTNAPPFPRELMKEILSKPDMVCYSWEINQERIIQWNAIHEIYLMDTRQTHAPGTAPASAWLRAAGPKLGNCATEVTLTGPNELTVLRNGPVGLTGLEMTLGEYWLDAPNFPLGLGYPPVKTIHSSRKPK